MFKWLLSWFLASFANSAKLRDVTRQAIDTGLKATAGTGNAAEIGLLGRAGGGQ